MMMTKQDGCNSGFILTGIISGITLTSLAISLHKQYHDDNNNKKKRNEKTNDTEYNNKKKKKQLLPLEFRQEQLSRTTLYFNNDNMNNIKCSTILVIGCHTTIGYECSVMLARNGIKHLYLIDINHDDDDNTPSLLQSRNIQEYIYDISNQYCNVTTYKNVSDCKDILNIIIEYKTNNNNKSFDYVIDATPTATTTPTPTTNDITNIQSKAKIIQYCLQNNIKIISTMDSNSKCIDPTRLNISDIQSASNNDIIATGIRYHLKNIMSKVDYKRYCCITDDNKESSSLLNVVYSSASSILPLPSFTMSTQTIVVSNNNDNTNKSIMKTIIGQICASYVLCQMGNKNYKPIIMHKRVGRHVRHKILQHFKTRYHLNAYTCNIDLDDVEFLMNASCWNCKCAIRTSDTSSKSTNVGEGLEIIYWYEYKDMQYRYSIFNLVLVSKENMEYIVQNGKSHLERDVVLRIEEKLLWMKNNIIGDSMALPMVES